MSQSFAFPGDSVDIYDYSKDFHLSLKSLLLRKREGEKFTSISF